MAICPECNSDLDLDEFDIDRGDSLSCVECGSNLEVVALLPVELATSQIPSDDRELDSSLFREDEEVSDEFQ